MPQQLPSWVGPLEGIDHHSHDAPHLILGLRPFARVADQHPVQLGQALLTLQSGGLQRQPNQFVVLVDQAPLARSRDCGIGAERDAPELLRIQAELAPDG
jgi:hypothetical protein